MAKTKRETSKVILTILAPIAVGVIIYACALMWHTGDTSGLAYLLPSVAAPMSTAIGFYYWKAKAENLVRMQTAAQESTEPKSRSKRKPPDPTALQNAIQQAMEGFFSQQNEQ